MTPDESNSPWIKWSKEFKKKKLSETLELTLNLFKKGKTISQIAEMREFKEESVEKHLYILITKSFLKVEDVIGEERVPPILKAIHKLGAKSLKAIREELGDSYSYFEIKCVLGSLSAKPEEL